MNLKLLLDTDVLIDYLRGQDGAINFIEDSTDNLLLSIISVAELYAGIKDKKEKEIINSFLNIFEIITIDYEIAALGGLLKSKYGKSHGTGLADALIAASAIQYKAKIVTLNLKHFPMVEIFAPYKKH